MKHTNVEVLELIGPLDDWPSTRFIIRSKDEPGN